MKYTLKESGKEKIIEKISFHFLQSYGEIPTVYIFGSFISMQAFSDIDIAIVTETALRDPLAIELELENELERTIKYPVDVRILNRAPISFCQNVFRTCRIIVDKDPNMRADFEGRILKHYFDFSLFRKRYLHEVINAPV